MVTYEQAVRLLQGARNAQKRLPVLLAQLHEESEARQRLTATYGETRVSSNHGVYICPAQKALEYTEEMRKRAEASVLKAVSVMDKAMKLLRLLPDDTAHVLEMHYISGWSMGKIARLSGVSTKTIKRWHTASLSALEKAISALQD